MYELLTIFFYQLIQGSPELVLLMRGRCGRYLMVVGYKTTYAISPYHH